jgi:dihydroorotase
MKILIKNGRVIDPASNFDEIADVAIAAWWRPRHWQI